MEMESTGEVMDTRKSSLFLVCAFLLLDVLIPNTYVYAEGLRFVEIPLEAFHDQKPLELQGLISSQTINIPIPESWLVNEGNWLEIKVRASPLLDAARSSMTISLNGLQISSTNLTSIPRAKRKIRIPASMFVPGNNSLTFTGTLYLPDDPQTNCQNWDDPSRWMAIDPGGFLHISFARKDVHSDLSYFPQGLVEPLEKYLPDEEKKQTLIVMPEHSTQDDLTSLSTISYELGSHTGTYPDWHPEIVSGRQLRTSIVSNRNIIFIGTLPQEFQDKVSNDKDYVALFPSPWGIGNAVMIIGDKNRQDGYTPASVFSDRAKSVLLLGNIAYTDQSPLPEPQPFQNHVSFEELGYLDRTVKGIGQQNLIYSIYIPYDVEPASVKLSLALVHSPDLDVLNSSFTVYLNGFSIAGILPTTQASTGEPISVGLPAKRFRRGINFIRVAFDLHVPHSSCERALDTVWATVLNSSALEMTYRNRTPIPSLKNFPLPFSDYPGFAYVIPNQYDQKDLDHISQLSFLLGAASYQPNRPPEVMTAANFEQKKTAYPNVILIGLPLQNSVTRSANELLPQPFIKDKNSLQEGYGVYLPASDTDASLGLMQIMPSPWVEGGTVLVLTGNDPQGLKWAWDVILNPTLQGNFSGNVMVVGSANRSVSSGGLSISESPQILFQQIADVSNIPIIGLLLQKYGQTFITPVLIAVATALLLIIGISWIIRLMEARKMSTVYSRVEEAEDEAR
jgi:hypothetical protein